MDASGARGPRGWPATVALWALALAAGAVLPFVLYALLVGVPYCLGPDFCAMASILDLPDPTGLILWYALLGAIGGIVPDTDWGLMYGVGLFIAVGVQPVGFFVWPWMVLLVVTWIVVRLSVEWVRRGQPG